MREVDRRSKLSRRIFMQGAAVAVPVAAITTGTSLGIEEAWAADATTLAPTTLKTMVKVARDIYPHDFLADSCYILAVKPWDGKAAKDPAIKVMLEEGVRRGYEGSSAEHGGYIKRGFADIDWLPKA